MNTEMNIGILSMLALALVIAVGYLRKLNTGVLSIGAAFLFGRFVVGMAPKEIVGGWPLKLFFVLLGMTFLFSIASVNGTLHLIAYQITSRMGRQRRLIPLVLFVLSAVLAALGPGNIAICALMLPIAMVISREEKIPLLLSASMVIAGANAGGLSPIAPTGIIGVTLAAEFGLNIGRAVFLKQIIGQALFAVMLYIFFKGYRLTSGPPKLVDRKRINRHQVLTLVVIVLVMAGILYLKWDIGLTAFLGAALLIFLKVVDENKAVASVPWTTLILICGVGLLVNVCRQAGGIDCLTMALSTFMNARLAAPIMAVTGGLMSLVSSASGVVMPTLLPAVPKLVASVGGNATQLVSAIIMGAHMVTNSPFSTLGALAVASAANAQERDMLLRGLLALAFVGVTYAAVIVLIGIV